MKNLLKKVLRQNPTIYDRVSRLYGLVASRHPLHSEIIKATAGLSSRLRFIQLGASDGMLNDPFRAFVVERKWTSVLVEPIPTSFDRLCSNYKHLISCGQVRAINAAVSYCGQEKLRLYRFSKTFIEQHPNANVTDFLQKTSFDASHLTKWGATSVSDLEEIEVDTITIEAIADKYFGGEIDFLAMDLEGYEVNVLLQVNLDLVSPRVILFEIEHIPADKFKTIEDRLSAFHYKIQVHGSDAIAIRSHR